MNPGLALNVSRRLYISFLQSITKPPGMPYMAYYRDIINTPSIKTYKIRAREGPLKPLQKRMGAFWKTFWNETDITYSPQFPGSSGCVFKDPCKMHTDVRLFLTAPCPGTIVLILQEKSILYNERAFPGKYAPKKGIRMYAYF